MNSAPPPPDGSDRELFRQAQAIAAGKPRITCSPNILNGSCVTTPTCRHCKWKGFKRGDTAFSRMRTREEFLLRGVQLSDAGIDRIFVASGWMGFELPEEYYDHIQALRQSVTCEIWALMGALSRESLQKLRDSGVDGYLCSIESPNETVYRRFRPGGDTLPDRIRALASARQAGLRLWSGFLVGFGETSEDVDEGIRMLADLGLDSISILPFLPCPGTPMERHDPANPYHWAVSMAKACVAMPDVHSFSDQTSGYLETFGRLGGANGFYVFPGTGSTPGKAGREHSTQLPNSPPQGVEGWRSASSSPDIPVRAMPQDI